ncbi:MAG TPA: hypothetical protein VGD40_10280 [Chryseosolibacter sp.]
MRTSLTRLKRIEDFIHGQVPEEDCVVFAANLLLDKELAADHRSQQQTYQLIKRCSRQQLKAELDQLHRDLMTKNQTFFDRILAIFQKH